MRGIFEPVPLGRGVTAKNRLCRSATEESMCRDGRITAEYVEHYRRLAAGGVGIVASGMVEVSRSGMFTSGTAAAWREDFADGLRPVCKAMGENGTVFIVQLVHSGFKARALPNPLCAPSVIETAAGVETRELTRGEIGEIVADFAAAAKKAKGAGADGVQIHNAHGYLPSEFFSPWSNHRTDEYGGSFENRARFVLEIYDAVRAAVGPDFLVGIKTNCSDMLDPSITLEDCVELLKALEARGLDYAEISGGLIAGAKWAGSLPIPPKESDEPPFYGCAAAIAEELTIPVYSVAGWRDPAVMEKYLNRGRLAGISMATPFIREPELAARWQSGDMSPAKCVGCFACARVSGYAVKCEPKPENIPQWAPVKCVFNR